MAAARQAGLHTALVAVPEEDHVTAGFDQADAAGFDVEASDFGELCRALGV